jgi:L-alanine-DL-glutamate epimerase-like enolase superfamily enzyme|tara:strand:- start:181 stop:309 length:129 start_codon:yes stop_codon:yes gene_type:complete
MPWFVNLFNEKMELKDGYLTIPNRPGCGFTLNPEVLDKNRLS